MSDPALLDLLEERGVLALVMASVRNRLQLSVPFQPCSCPDKEVAQHGRIPHGPKCSAWSAVKALGLLAEVVELDHLRAVHMSQSADREINHLIRGRRVNRDKVIKNLKVAGWDGGMFFQHEVDRVMAAQEQLAARDNARMAEAQAIDDLRRGELERRPSLMTIRSIPADSERPPDGST